MNRYLPASRRNLKLAALFAALGTTLAGTTVPVLAQSNDMPAPTPIMPALNNGNIYPAFSVWR